MCALLQLVMLCRALILVSNIICYNQCCLVEYSVGCESQTVHAVDTTKLE